MFEGEQRYIKASISVWTHRVATCRRLHRRRHRPGGPRDRCRRVHREDAIHAETARLLADYFVMAADEVDQWAAMTAGSTNEGRQSRAKRPSSWWWRTILSMKGNSS